MCAQHACHANSNVIDMLSPSAAAFDTVQHLDFSKNYLGWRGVLPLLDVIARFHSLLSLNLCHNYVTNDCMPRFCEVMRGLPCIVRVDLSCNPISYAAGKQLVALIAAVPTLRQVKVDCTLMNPGLAKRVVRAAGGRALDGAEAADVGDDAHGGDGRPYKGVLSWRPLPPPSRCVVMAAPIAASAATAASPLPQPHRSFGDDDDDDIRRPESARRSIGSPPAAAAEGSLGLRDNGASKSPPWVGIETLWSAAVSQTKPPRQLFVGLSSVLAIVRGDPEFGAAAAAVAVA